MRERIPVYQTTQGRHACFTYMHHHAANVSDVEAGRLFLLWRSREPVPGGEVAKTQLANERGRER